MSEIVGIDIGGTSVKAVALGEGGAPRATANSDTYENPGRDELSGAVRGCLKRLGVSSASRVGLCLPGKVKPDQSAISVSVNLPVLNGWTFADLLGSVFDHAPESWRVSSDADAAGFDFAATYPIDGRTAAISIGTGVGLCVLDGTVIARIGEKGIGHLGLMDVGQHGGEDRVDSHGARNTLESYIGSAALADYKADGKLDLSRIDEGHPSIAALVHSLRIVHAIYQPDRIALLGGVGIALEPQGDRLHRLVSDGLTTLASSGWTLEFGTSSYHAAIGAAKLALQDR